MFTSSRKIKWLYALMLAILLSGVFVPAKAQYFSIDSNKKRISIPFKLVRNMVVIRMKINGKGPFNFVLDTGVGLMIITEPKMIDSINLASKRTIKIPGLGEQQDGEAYLTSELNIDIPGLKSHNVYAALLKNDQFDLSSYAGMPIDGLLGYEFFNKLAVKLNFSDSTLRICRPKDIRPLRKGIKIPLAIQDRKPYIQSDITFTNGIKADTKLVVDIGAGHPVSIENLKKSGGLPKKYINANLGVGLNGPIQGVIGRIAEIDLGKYKLNDVLAAFPDNSSVNSAPAVSRDGNLGIGILKRFDVLFDYPDSVMYLKPGFLYQEPFEHDMSGLEYYAGGENYEHVIINRVEPGSAGDEIGLEKGDEIVSINLKPVSRMSLEQIDALFKSREDKSVLLLIFHDKKYDNVVLTLKRRI